MSVKVIKGMTMWDVFFTLPVLLLLNIPTYTSGQCGISAVANGKIISGVTARPGAWPWMVSINYRGRISHFCGGSLISPTWVLTASHCVAGENATSLKVIIGEHDRFRREGTEQHVKVKKIIMHPNYDPMTLHNDIALLEVEQPVRLNQRAQLICLPPLDYRPGIGKKCFLSGWGSMTYPGKQARYLQQAMLPVVNKKHCFDEDSFICTGFGDNSLTNACRGDSGGPLVCQEDDGRWVLQGVTSFVVTYCKYYTAFVPVGDYVNWIKQHI